MLNLVYGMLSAQERLFGNHARCAGVRLRRIIRIMNNLLRCNGFVGSIILDYIVLSEVAEDVDAGSVVRASIGGAADDMTRSRRGDRKGDSFPYSTTVHT